MTAAPVHPQESSGPGRLGVSESAALTRRATALSLASALALSLIKFAGWRASGSVALLASLADSGLDIAAALATFAAVRYAAVPPDYNHRFGHGKAEAFSSLFQAALVFASALVIGWDAVHRLIRPEPIRTGGLAVAIMAVSTLATCGLIWVQTHTLRRSASVAVSGDRTHQFADLGSSLAALAGIAIAAFLHLPRADAAAGLLVVAWLVWGAASVLRESSASLMDEELDDADRATIKALVLADPRIADVHELRTRASGAVMHVQMHVALDPEITLETVHKILVRAETRILERFPAADILIHPDPRGRAEPHGGAFSETPHD